MPTHPSTRSIRPVIFAVVLVTLLYAMVRYHLAKGVPWSQLPLFTLNKVISVTAVFLLGWSYTAAGKNRRARDGRGVPSAYAPAQLGLGALALAFLHGFLSLALLRPLYYSRMFAADGIFSLSGSCTVLLGAGALFCLILAGMGSLPGMADKLGEHRVHTLLRTTPLALLLTASHIVAVGWPGWWTPGHWPWTLVPISLIAFLMSLAPFVIRWMPVRKPGSLDGESA